MGDAVRGFSGVWMKDTCNPFFIYCCGHSFMEGHQVGKNEKANGKNKLVSVKVSCYLYRCQYVGSIQILTG